MQFIRWPLLIQEGKLIYVRDFRMKNIESQLNIGDGFNFKNQKEIKNLQFSPNSIAFLSCFFA